MSIYFSLWFNQMWCGSMGSEENKRVAQQLFAPEGGPNCLYDSEVDTRFSCPMVKRGRVSNNYEFEGCAATL